MEGEGVIVLSVVLWVHRLICSDFVQRFVGQEGL